MTNTIKKFTKTLIVSFIALQLVITSQAYAYHNLKIHNVNESKRLTIEKEDNKQVLKQEWYGMKFELNTNSRNDYRTVNYREYERALKQVKFDLGIIGEYNVYFLDTKLKDYSKAMALSFMDDSVVVFGTDRYLSRQYVNRLAIHELGHQVDFELMDEEKWDEYRKIRGIENTTIYNNSSRIYYNRPQEIFAEDFRIILGGELAKRTSHLNASLENPSDNAQLVEFFNDLVK